MFVVPLRREMGCSEEMLTVAATLQARTRHSALLYFHARSTARASPARRSRPPAPAPLSPRCAAPPQVRSLWAPMRNAKHEFDEVRCASALS